MMKNPVFLQKNGVFCREKEMCLMIFQKLLTNSGS